MAFLGMGTEELVVIVVIVVLLFGAQTIPKLAQSMGRAKGEFARAKRDFEAEAAKAEAMPTDARATTALPAESASEEQVRATARSLGISEAGKSVTEVKALIAQKLA